MNISDNFLCRNWTLCWNSCSRILNCRPMVVWPKFERDLNSLSQKISKISKIWYHQWKVKLKITQRWNFLWNWKRNCENIEKRSANFAIFCVRFRKIINLPIIKGLKIFNLRADFLKIVSKMWYQLIVFVWYLVSQIMILPYFWWITFFDKSTVNHPCVKLGLVVFMTFLDEARTHDWTSNF